ncbi:MAG: HAD-IIIA family hydrolase [Chloroflexi bacterium]|nr:MAG: HAD-IIIA family hydrolase [Chloroflexota bacterium]
MSGSGDAARAVLLDRDGVLNEPIVVDGTPRPPASLEALVVTGDTEVACRDLRRAGLLLIMVTNQPDVARGAQDRATVDAINLEVRRRVGLDDVLVCPHDDADGCACRKPAPGLILEAAARWGLDLAGSVVVGDRWRDVGAGRAAGCATVLIDRRYAERPAVGADLVAGSLRQAVPWIVRRAAAAGGRR